MLGLRRALAALFVVGVIFAGFDVALVLVSDHAEQKAISAVLGPLIGLSFIGTGLFAWWRRPLNRFGLLMTAVGFAWFLAALTYADDPTVHTVGAFLAPLYLVLVIHMVLAFPSGRLQTRTQRALVAVTYVDAFVVTLPWFLLGGDISGGNEDAPGNAWAIAHEESIASAFDAASSLIAVGIAVAAILVLLRKRRVATAPQRRAQAPDAVDRAGRHDAARARLPRRRARPLPTRSSCPSRSPA